ncbi:MAG TPA: hypothetical protein VGW38_12690 [Chloroflexota bacterium]|nr:hypothetical protein [Chloroflexota bacterium]
MVDCVQRLLRFHAGLEAAQHLTLCHLNRFEHWAGRAFMDPGRQVPGLALAAELFEAFLAMACTAPLSQTARNRYRDAELRRIAAFCYSVFHAEEAGLDTGGMSFGAACST